MAGLANILNSDQYISRYPADTMKSYSDNLKEIDNLTAKADFSISHTLLHDVILMEVRAYAMLFAANKKREEQRIKKAMEEKVDKIQNSLEEDDIEELEILKKCISDIENKEDKSAAIKLMANYNLEGKKPTRFFCKLNKKMKSVAQWRKVLGKSEI